MEEKKRIQKVLQLLRASFPREQIFLEHESALELLIATILSAQCTDARVNIVTKKLFKKYTTLEEYVHANPREFEKDIHSTGFYKNKTKNILAACKKIKFEFGGNVPQTMEQLLLIPGVGRKTANIVLSQGFGIQEGITVDTHVQRLSQRLGLSKNKSPKKIEQDLMRVVPKTEYWWLNTALINHGRATCLARKPNCKGCFLNRICPSAFRTENHSKEPKTLDQNA